MKHMIRFSALFGALAGILTLAFLLSSPTFGKTPAPSSGESGDRTLSPYFHVTSQDSEVDQLPLKATSARVNISGVIADVQVTQTYRNQGKRPLEALYVFPASTRAAVYGMKMTIGPRVIEAKINKREDARREYEQARDQGKTASLLEQQRPNVFQMNVANILPGDEILVELKYTELLVPTGGVYEFIYPTVVGPRYSNRPKEAVPPGEHWVENPYFRQGQTVPYTFDLDLAVSAGMPIKDVSCPSHKVKVNYDGPSLARITLDPSAKDGGNRDYILHYRLGGDRIASGLLLYEGEHENFFLFMAQPPKRVETAKILNREYIFIIDVSGSMFGYPLDISKELLRDLLGGLRPSDRFNVILFSGGSSVMSERSLPVTTENIRRAIALIERQQGGGGTELLPALRCALAMKKSENYSRTLIIATDGYVDVEEEAFDLIRNNLGNANLFAFGIGTSVNRHIIEGMAHVGMGEPFIITSPDEAPAKAERFRTIIQSPVLTQVKATFDAFAAYDVEPSAIPDLLSERPVIVFGKYRGKPQGTVTVSGISGEGPYSETVDVGRVQPLVSHAGLRYLWARHRIALLSDYNRLRSNDTRVKTVTDLGLAYHLLTTYTSFVAVDTEVRAVDGKAVTVKQPLPLPKGVSDHAVGGLAGSLPALAHSPSLMADMAMRGGYEQKARYKAPAARYDGRTMAETGDHDETALEKENADGQITPGGAISSLTISVREVTVSGGLSREAAARAVEHHARELEKFCPERDLTGELVVRVIIAPNGKVREVTVVKSGLNGKGAERWMVEQIRKWQFPANKDSQKTTATIVLVAGVYNGLK